MDESAGNGPDPDIESKIMETMQEFGSCTFTRLAEALPEYSFTQMFLEVDRLSRNGALIFLRHPHLLEHVVELKLQKAS